MLDKQKCFWVGRLQPGLRPLTMAQLRQAALAIKDGGVGNTLPSEVVLPVYIWSRLDTAIRFRGEGAQRAGAIRRLRRGDCGGWRWLGDAVRDDGWVIGAVGQGAKAALRGCSRVRGVLGVVRAVFGGVAVDFRRRRRSGSG
jgi:hypothetical protein